MYNLIMYNIYSIFYYFLIITTAIITVVLSFARIISIVSITLFLFLSLLLLFFSSDYCTVTQTSKHIHQLDCFR